MTGSTRALPKQLGNAPRSANAWRTSQGRSTCSVHTSRLDSATKAPPDAPARSGSPQSNVFGSVAAGTADDELVGVTPLEVMARLRDELAVLDQYYVPTRYPNGLPGGIPSDVYTRAQASAVVDIACRIVAVVRRELAVSSGGHDASAPAEGGPLPDATASPQGTAAASESPPEEEHGAPEGGGGE